MVLVDTSVWIDSFRKPNPQLADLLRTYQVLIHPMVLGELACGNLKNRAAFLKHVSNLNTCNTARHQEIISWIDRFQVQGRGLGWVDVNLLHTCWLTGATVWSLDKGLQAIAREQSYEFTYPA